MALICSTLIALNQANATGNYSVFREMGAPGFQVVNSTAKLSEIFAELRGKNFDLSPIVVMQPKLLRRPELDKGGMLRVTGFFLTQPERLNFDLIYEPVDGQWRLFGIAANTTPNEAAALNKPPVDAPEGNAVLANASAPAPKPTQVVQTATPSSASTTPGLPPVKDTIDQLEAMSSAPISEPASSPDTSPLNPLGWFQ